MSRYDPDKVTLYPTPNIASTRERRVGSRKRLMLPLDAELAEAVILLGDYFPAYRKDSILEQVFSILLLTLVTDDPDGTIDAMERVASTVLKPGDMDTGKMWGEFMSIVSTFGNVYEYDSSLKEGLEELMPGDLRVFPEEIFQVKWSRGANYLLVE